MSDTTVITIADGNWNYLPTLVAAARVAASQIPLPETTAARIIFRPDKDNSGDGIFRVGDPLSGAEGEKMLADATYEDNGAGHEYGGSLRNWYIKGTIGDKLEIAMIN